MVPIRTSYAFATSLHGTSSTMASRHFPAMPKSPSFRGLLAGHRPPTHALGSGPARKQNQTPPCLYPPPPPLPLQRRLPGKSRGRSYELLVVSC
jgi:hypothetical protein